MEVGGTTSGRTAPADGSLVLEGFVDVQPIAAGGDSTIYRAHQPSLDRDVAIKVVNLSDPEELRRFNREISLTVRLGRAHPNIVSVLDTRTLPDGRPCIVMDLFELGSTHDRLRSTGPFNAEEVVTIGRVIGDALAFAHAQRVVHRDVKPQNILIMPTSYVLADFGIARFVDAGHTASLERLSYRHASPEVLDGQSPAPSDDLWSLCSTMATLFEGRAPFAADDPDDDTALAYLRRVRTAQRRPLPADAPESLASIIDRGMHPDRSRRYERAEDLIADLRSLEREFIGWAPSTATDAGNKSDAGSTGGPAEKPADESPASASGPRSAVDVGPLDRDDAPTAPRSPAPPPKTDLPPDSDDLQWAPGATPRTAEQSVDDRADDGQKDSDRQHGGMQDDEQRTGDAQRIPAGLSAPVAPGNRALPSSDAVAPAVSVAALISAGTGGPTGVPGQPAGSTADAAPTGLRPAENPPPIASADAAGDQPKTPPKVRTGIIVLAVVLLLGSAVLAYFLAKPAAPQQRGQVPGGITQINGVGGQGSSGGGASEAPAGNPTTVRGGDLSDPDYLPQVLSVSFKNGFVTLVVDNPEAEGARFVVFDATDQDDQTRQGPLAALNTDYLQPADGPRSSLTVRFPTERCGQLVRFAVMAMNSDASKKGLGWSTRIQAPDC